MTACMLALAFSVQRAGSLGAYAAASSLPTITVADFEFIDLAPAGERYDVRQDQARLRLITGEVRRLVARAGSFTLLDRGRADQAPPYSFRSCPACIWDWARARGARFVIVGAVEKESRLILWAQMSLLDAERRSVVSQASLSMRDDTDEMWKAAADNLTNRILAGMPRRGAAAGWYPRYDLCETARVSQLKVYP